MSTNCEWIDCGTSIYTMKYHSGTKRNKLPTHTPKWINLKCFLPSERSQTQLYDFTYTMSGKGKTIGTKITLVIVRSWSWRVLTIKRQKGNLGDDYGGVTYLKTFVKISRTAHLTLLFRENSTILKLYPPKRKKMKIS